MANANPSSVGCLMNRLKAHFWVSILVLTTLALTSCSGPFKGCTTNCQIGNATMNVSISDASPANTSIMSFSLPILSVTLTPSTGSPVSLFSSTTGATFDLTRFQADSDLLASNVSVAAGAYTAVSVTVGAPSGVFFNGSTAAVGSCAAGQVCSVPPGTAGTLTFTFTSPLTLTANQAQWLDLDFNYNNAIVTTNGIGIDITQPNFLTALSTPPMGIPTGDFANIDDFTGAVTAVSSSSI